MNGIPPFPGNVPASFHFLPQGRVVYAHLPVSVLHTYPPPGCNSDPALRQGRAYHEPSLILQAQKRGRATLVVARLLPYRLLLLFCL